MSTRLEVKKRQTPPAVLQNLGINQAQAHVGMAMGIGIDLARGRNTTSSIFQKLMVRQENTSHRDGSLSWE